MGHWIGLSIDCATRKTPDFKGFLRISVQKEEKHARIGGTNLPPAKETRMARNLADRMGTGFRRDMNCHKKTQGTHNSFTKGYEGFNHG
jgi:hypothetical protein